MRTYSRSDWDRAQNEWDDFSGEWREVRHRAAMRGILFPPSGTKWDSWGDDFPTQRAILIRAIRETPTLLRESIDSSRSWSEVIDKLLHRLNDEVRVEVMTEEREIARRKAEEPSPREATKTFGELVERAAESLGYHRDRTQR